MKVLQASGSTSLRAIAEGLDARGIPTAKGGTWSATQVMRLTARQGKSGLGLGAQRNAVDDFLNGAVANTVGSASSIAGRLMRSPADGRCSMPAAEQRNPPL